MNILYNDGSKWYKLVYFGFIKIELNVFHVWSILLEKSQLCQLYVKIYSWNTRIRTKPPLHATRLRRLPSGNVGYGFPPVRLLTSRPSCFCANHSLRKHATAGLELFVFNYCQQNETFYYLWCTWHRSNRLFRLFRSVI